MFPPEYADSPDDEVVMTSASGIALTVGDLRAFEPYGAFALDLAREWSAMKASGPVDEAAFLDVMRRYDEGAPHTLPTLLLYYINLEPLLNRMDSAWIEKYFRTSSLSKRERDLRRKSA